MFLFLYEKTVLTGGTEKESYFFLKETVLTGSTKKNERETAFRSGLYFRARESSSRALFHSMDKLGSIQI